ncbi:hypothetical protein VchM-138_0041 [Vibrio phage vB_VchM-138]|uniref:hypothetical protein n=1 Tax=Vibrio phage vB_VchM-138 TaxID=1127518 RepID=UPI0002536E18|nr:hypothetical protein F397_gp41 [Vibrio phage vB_VchM-138]AFC22720.1 hypothetical protein VchM-138_0041 [Vibrio phage vB_VchM-138]
MSNTIDLRGNEQVCTRREAEQYASFKGYDMMIFGNDPTPTDVDAEAKHDNPNSNRLFTNYDLIGWGMSHPDNATVKKVVIDILYEWRNTPVLDAGGFQQFLLDKLDNNK